jgi:lactoylglutathione lyase
MSQMRTLHLGVRVSDLDRSLAFYRRLGYEVVGTVPGTPLGDLAMLKLPDDEFVTLELVAGADTGKIQRGSLSHFVISVGSMEAALSELAARGLSVEPPRSPDGSGEQLTAWIADPDGNRIELVQWPAGHPEGMTGGDFADDNRAT